MTAPPPRGATRAEGAKGPSPWLRLLPGISPKRRSYVLAWYGFTLTFGGMRLLTWLIHIDVGGFGDVSAGGVHLHHYVWGILLLMVVGAAGLSENSPRARAWLGLAYGVGMALVIDEAALLISLEDVYWDTEGGLSIAIAITVIAVVGTVLAVTRGRRASRAEEEAGRKPAEEAAEPRRGDS